MALDHARRAQIEHVGGALLRKYKALVAMADASAGGSPNNAMKEEFELKLMHDFAGERLLAETEEAERAAV